MLSTSVSRLLALAAFVAVGVLLPDLQMNYSPTRKLTVDEEKSPTTPYMKSSFRKTDSEHRKLFEIPDPPAGFELTCGANQEVATIDFSNIWGFGVTYGPPGPESYTNTLTSNDGTELIVTLSRNSEWATLHQFSLYPDQGLYLTMQTDPKFRVTWIDDTDGVLSSFPNYYVSVQIDFPEELGGVLATVGGLSSTNDFTSALRVRMLDDSGSDVTVSTTTDADFLVLTGNYAYSNVKNQGRGGYLEVFDDKNVYAKSSSGTKSLRIDLASFSFSSGYHDFDAGRSTARFSAVIAPEIQYCKDTAQPSLSAFSADTGGVNGDPLIMGLAGQIFKFEGRSGAWYSAVSTPSLQWNMRIQEYEDCPDDSNKFVSGVGFTTFNKKKKKKNKNSREPAHKIVVNVVNEFGTKIGCGSNHTNCLGNGSVEILIDDEKILYPGDYHFKDGSGRVIAFNTFLECSRKWYDFDITPTISSSSSDKSETAAFGRRRLKTQFPGVFDVVKNLKDTMVDKDVCDAWISDRQKKGDLFHQAGEWSTVIIKTNDISFHVEYKQEHRRCSAHTIDVWISSVSSNLFDEEWHGIIGETKDPANHGEEKVEREEFLKYANDRSYEVVSPFAVKCEGCYLHSTNKLKSVGLL